MTSNTKDFVVMYQGNPVILSTSPAGGFEMDCPSCNINQWLDPDPSEGHAVWESENGGGVSVRPSIVCACGLHILIENGEARDV